MRWSKVGEWIKREWRGPTPLTRKWHLDRGRQRTVCGRDFSNGWGVVINDKPRYKDRCKNCLRRTAA